MTTADETEETRHEHVRRLPHRRGRGDRVPDAVKALHTAFELSGEGTIRPEQPFGEFA